MQFFKVILASTIEAKKLKIPDAFTRYLNGYSKKVVLQNRIGRWHVIMDSNHEGVFFLNGWQQFVEDNHVEASDILVFEYSGDIKFDVIIFGKYEVEKRETSASLGVDIDVKMEEEEEEEEEEKTRNEAEMDVNFEFDFDDDLGDTEYSEKDSKESEYNEEVEEEEMEDTEEELETRTNFMRRGIKIKKQGKRTRVRVGTLPAAEVRKYVQCQNPYFVAKGGPGQRNLLFVPSYVLKDFDLELPEHVTFCDELGRKWPGQVIHWKDGRTCIKGWRVVCRWNHVQNDDRCICEFPRRKGRKQQHILVHIVRGVGSGSQN